MGGVRGLGGGGGCEAFEGLECRGFGALGDQRLAALFDALYGIESSGDFGGVEPGLEFAQCEVVEVAEVEGGEVGVEEVAEEGTGV